jgi:hypothetical protein
MGRCCDSWTGTWVGAVNEVLIHSTGVLGNANPRHGFIMYDLVAGTSNTSLMQTSIPVPCSHMWTLG